MTKELNVSQREKIAQAADEWLVNSPESNIFAIPRQVVATAFDVPRWRAVSGKQKSWDGCANMKFRDLLADETNHTARPANGSRTFGTLFDSLIADEVHKALLTAGGKQGHRPTTMMAKQVLNRKTIDERVAYWRKRLLRTCGASPLAQVIMIEPNRSGFYLYRPHGDKVVGDTHDVADATRIEKLPLPSLKTAQAIVEFHTETTPDMKAVEMIDFDIHYIRASVVNDGALIARLDGVLFSWPQPLKHLANADFLSACDSISQELAEFAYYMLVEHRSAQTIFAKGAVFYLHHWEVAQRWRGRGVGWDMVCETLEMIRHFQPATATVAVDLAPLQYLFPLPPMTPAEIRQAYIADRARLLDYWERRFKHRVLGPISRTLHFEVNKSLTREELVQAIESLTGQREHLSS
jgi:hypothetical protein